jgi:hypothetical protein
VTPPWAQVGITDVPAARDFLETLRARDTIVLASTDGDVGYPLTRQSQRFRGHGATVSANIFAATPPAADLVAYHRTLGLGPERVYCPNVASERAPLARLLLDDAEVLARLRADGSLARIVVAFKDQNAALLIERLQLTPVYCDPSPAAYTLANDKLALARAGPEYGFETLPAEVVTDERSLDATFHALAERYGEGCIVRRRRGAAGRDIHHAATLPAARRLWRRLRAHGEVLLVPYVPPGSVLRNVATHGIVTAAGFAPLMFSDQILRGYRFGGGRVTPEWPAAQVAAIRAGLAGVARWLRDLGYTGAPAGVDGFLMDGPSGPRFVVIDPNARLTATMGPWAVVAVLAEAAARPFVWQFEWRRMFGAPLTLDRLRRRLGSDLLAPTAIERGGVLPTFLISRRLGAFGASGLWAILLAHDASHLEHLRRRVRELALIVR